MSILITEDEIIEMPEELLRDLRVFLKKQRNTGLIADPDVRVPSRVSNETNNRTRAENKHNWIWEDHNLRITEVSERDVLNGFPKGLRVEQGPEGVAKREYIAVKWQFTEDLRDFLELALKYGFDKLWREGHPQHAHLDGNSKYKTGVKHISFGRSHTERWIFSIHVDISKAPDIRFVIFEKGQQSVVEKVLGDALANGEPLPGQWKWERGGGKNIKVHPMDVKKILKEMI